MRDRGLPESALGRPQNRFAYEDVDLAASAAAILELAAGSVGEDGLASWIRDNLPAS